MKGRGQRGLGPIGIRRPAVALALAAALAAGGRAEDLAVDPGTLVRWPGEGIESCGQGGGEWSPIDGACWYAVDLLAGEGRAMVWRRRGGRREEAALRVGRYPYSEQRITLADDSQVNLSAADLERAGAEAARIGALWSRQTPRRFTLPLAPPLNELPEGGRFGSRRVFNDQPRSPHSGADYAAPEGAPVLAVADGTVALEGDFFFSGRSLFLDHGDGLLTMYFHLSSALVSTGDQVRRGERIGLVGQSGRATGPHLHFGVRWRGSRVDPAQLLAPVGEIPALP